MPRPSRQRRGRDLSSIIHAERPHLVLLDLMLPGSDDGIELLKKVPELARTPVVLFSGYGHDNIVVRAFEVDAADYIVKPFSGRRLP